MPVFEGGQTLVIDIGAKAVEHDFVSDLSALVDGDLDNLVPGRSGQLPRPHAEIRGGDGQGGTNLVAIQRALRQGAVCRSGLRAVPERGKRLSFCLACSSQASASACTVMEASLSARSCVTDPGLSCWNMRCFE
jgi:hypothetical protein